MTAIYSFTLFDFWVMVTKRTPSPSSIIVHQHQLSVSFVYQWLYNFLDDSVNLDEIHIIIESQVNAVNFQTIHNLHKTFVVLSLQESSQLILVLLI